MSSNPDGELQNASSSTKDVPEPPIEPIHLPTIEEIRDQDIWNICAVCSLVSGVMGGGLGLFMGLFLGALDNPIMQEEMIGRQQLVYQAKQIVRRSWSSCKAFAIMGFIFSASECIIEKVTVFSYSLNLKKEVAVIPIFCCSILFPQLRDVKYTLSESEQSNFVLDVPLHDCFIFQPFEPRAFSYFSQ